MAIGIIQIGLKRFSETTKTNHKKLYDTLSKKYGISVYDFYRNSADPQCPFDQSGKVQVYDFFTACKKVNEDIVVKIRSDVYLTRNAIDVVCKEIDNVIAGETDVVYLGIDFLNDYNQTHKRENARHCAKITDFMIIARKNKIANSDEIISAMKNNVKDKSGNKTFFLILGPDAVATKVSCQMYLVRKEYSDFDNWQIYWDWCQQYRKSEAAQEWVKNNASLIRSF